MAGYSGTPLARKLGIKAGHRVALLDAPDDFARVLGALPSDVTLTSSLAGKQPLDVMVLFALTQADVSRTFTRAAKRLAPAGGLWVAWPKRASGIATDVTENTVRAVMLGAGLVDNKVCAIDDTWSGLRAVVRVVDRPRAAPKKPPRKRS